MVLLGCTEVGWPNIRFGGLVFGFSGVSGRASFLWVPMLFGCGGGVASSWFVIWGLMCFDFVLLGFFLIVVYCCMDMWSGFGGFFFECGLRYGLGWVIWVFWQIVVACASGLGWGLLDEVCFADVVSFGC